MKEREEWKGHWKKEDDPMNPKRLGGGKRPKLFKSVDQEDLETKDEDSSDDKKTNN